MPQRPPLHSHSPTPTPRSSSRGRSLSRDTSRSRDASPVGQMTNHGKRRRERSPSERCYKHHREQSPGDWMVHPLLPLIHHENSCVYCNEYAMHFASGAAASGHGFREAMDGLIDRATAFIGRESSSDLAAQVDHLRNQHDELTHELCTAREEITCLSRGSHIPHPSSIHDEACQLERAHLSSLGMPMEINQHDAGPSRVTPSLRSFSGRVQAEPANNIIPVAVSASRSQESPATTSSCKGKEREWQTSPAPPCTVLPYNDVQMDEMAPGMDAFHQAQETLFPEFTGQEPLKNVAILGDQLDTKGVHTLFVHMGNYVYAYQGDMIARALENYNRGRQPPTPSRRQANAAIRFKDGIMGPIRL